MADKILACSNLAMAFSADGWEYGTDNSGAAGYSSGYKVAVLRFDVPSVPGVGKTLDVGMVISKVTTDSANVRWALCKSDANREKYLATADEVEDENQIASGKILFENLTSSLGMRHFEIPCKGIKKGTWYLILWASELTGIYIRSVVSNYGTHSAVITYTGGVVWIKTESGVKPHGIYNGAKQRLTPYIQTAAGPKPCG